MGDIFQLTDNRALPKDAVHCISSFMSLRYHLRPKFVAGLFHLHVFLKKEHHAGKFVLLVVHTVLVNYIRDMSNRNNFVVYGAALFQNVVGPQLRNQILQHRSSRFAGMTVGHHTRVIADAFTEGLNKSPPVHRRAANLILVFQFPAQLGNHKIIAHMGVEKEQLFEPPADQTEAHVFQISFKVFRLDDHSSRKSRCHQRKRIPHLYSRRHQEIEPISDHVGHPVRHDRISAHRQMGPVDFNGARRYDYRLFPVYLFKLLPAQIFQSHVFLLFYIVKLRSPVLVCRHLLPYPLLVIHVQNAVHDTFLIGSSGDDQSTRVCNAASAEKVVVVLIQRHHIQQVVQSGRLNQDVPLIVPRRIESRRNKEHVDILQRQRPQILCKSELIADGYAHFTEVKIEDSNFISGIYRFRLF